MSAEARPISLVRFAQALTALPLENLYLKADELRNSIAHLQLSNGRLRPYVDEGDHDCTEALVENVAVIVRMEERVRLVRGEVERRGAKWDEELDGGGEGEDAKEPRINGRIDGHGDDVKEQETVGGQDHHDHTGSTSGANEAEPMQGLTDEELAERIRERLDAVMGNDDGVHL